MRLPTEDEVSNHSTIALKSDEILFVRIYFIQIIVRVKIVDAPLEVTISWLTISVFFEIGNISTIFSIPEAVKSKVV